MLSAILTSMGDTGIASNHVSARCSKCLQSNEFVKCAVPVEKPPIVINIYDCNLCQLIHSWDDLHVDARNAILTIQQAYQNVENMEEVSPNAI